MITIMADAKLFKEDDKPVNADVVEIPSENIIYEDLVFTLHEDHSKLYRPVVEMRGDKFVVVGNASYFRAAKDAGHRVMSVDLIPDENIVANLGHISGEHGLIVLGRPTISKFKNRFLFFDQPPRDFVPYNFGVTTNVVSKTAPYKNHNCLRFSVPTDSVKIEHKLIERAVSINGKLRSLDGLTRIGRYKDYFS